jgi:hypothetical protein
MAYIAYANNQEEIDMAKISVAEFESKILAQ